MTARSAARSARADRAEATRARVVAAAAPLFVERGYLDTTMSAIAKAASVAVQTLYLSFGSKAAVLEAVWASVDDPHPDGWLGRLAAAPDGPAAIALHVAATTPALERRHPIARVLLAAAADPEPAAVLEQARKAAYDHHAEAVDELAELPGFTLAITVQRATEIAVALLSQEAYGLLVGDHGWTAPDWTEWTTRHLAADLFPPAWQAEHRHATNGASGRPEMPG